MLKKEIDPCSAGLRCFIWDWWNCHYLWHVGLLLNQKGRVNMVNILHLDVTCYTVYHPKVNIWYKMVNIFVIQNNSFVCLVSFNMNICNCLRDFPERYLRKWYWECFGCCQTRFVSFIPTKKLSVSTELVSTMSYINLLDGLKVRMRNKWIKYCVHFWEK